MLRSKRIIGLVIMAALVIAAAFPAAPVSALGSWANTGSLSAAYEGLTLTVLPAESGNTYTKVLSSGAYTTLPQSWSRIYNPSTGSWTSASNNLHDARHRNTATLVTMGDGSKRVLVTGGFGLFTTLQTAELFNLSTMSWNSSGSTLTMQSKHAAHAAAKLNDGRVLIVAGDSAANGASEIYDPTSGTDGSFSTAANLPQVRANHTATTLTDGKVLVAGGCCGSNNKYTYVYSPTIDTWTKTTGDLTNNHDRGVAVLLNNGKVLLAGGYSTGSTTTATAELYDPSTDTWSTTGSMNVARVQFSLTLLANGKVLAAGGTNNLSSTEIYDPSAGTWTTDTSMSTARYNHGAAFITMSDGTNRVLVAGGANSSGRTSSSELYTP